MLCAHFLKDTSHENAPKLGLIRDIRRVTVKQLMGNYMNDSGGGMRGDEPAEPVCTTAVVIIQLWQSGP